MNESNKEKNIDPVSTESNPDTNQHSNSHSNSDSAQSSRETGPDAVKVGSKNQAKSQTRDAGREGAESETHLRRASSEKEKKPKRVCLKKVDHETAKLIGQIKEKANKKQFGRKIRDSEIIAIGLKLITPEQILALQETTYSERDRLQMVHEEYQKANGRISLDHFIGKLLRGQIQVSQ